MYPKIDITEVYTIRGPLKNIYDMIDNKALKNRQYFDMRECKEIVNSYITKEALDRENSADPDVPGPVMKGGMVRVDPALYNFLT